VFAHNFDLLSTNFHNFRQTYDMLLLTLLKHHCSYLVYVNGVLQIVIIIIVVVVVVVVVVVGSRTDVILLLLLLFFLLGPPLQKSL